MTPDIERLRRFALIAGLALIFYAAAGVELDREAKFSLLGLPFIVRRPDLIFLGLMLASTYALARFYFYGVMLKHSPQRRRADLFREMHGYGAYGTFTGFVFFAPPTYSTTPSITNRGEVEIRLKEIVDAFPKVGKFRARGKIEGYQASDDDGEPYTVYYAEITIPLACRVSAFIEDIDYTIPIWLNIGALVLSVATLWR